MVLFAQVVREGSFTAAARRQGVSKQAVSDRIARLERLLGVRLLERTTRSLRLTEPGVRYHERCASIAAEIATANAEVLGHSSEPLGRLRVSVPVVFGRRFVLPVVVELAKRHPKLTLEIVLADRRVNLVEEAFDVAIRVGALDDSNFVVRKLGYGRVHYVASPGFIRAHGAITAERLASVPALGMQPRETWKVQGHTFRVQPHLVINDLELLTEAACAGLGVARVPSFVHARAVTEKRLRLLCGGEPAMQQPIHAVFPSRVHLAPKVKVFVDAIAEHSAKALPGR